MELKDACNMTLKTCAKIMCKKTHHTKIPYLRIKKSALFLHKFINTVFNNLFFEITKMYLVFEYMFKKLLNKRCSGGFRHSDRGWSMLQSRPQSTRVRFCGFRFLEIAAEVAAHGLNERDRHEVALVVVVVIFIISSFKTQDLNIKWEWRQCWLH